MSSNLIFYPILIMLGLITSFTDLKSGHIRNKHLLLATILGLLFYLYLLITHQYVFTIHFALNIIIGLSIGMLLYLTDSWGAGDAKLYFVVCLLMPTDKYSNIFPFASLTVFTNIFVLSTCVLFCLSMYQLIKYKSKTLDTINRVIKSKNPLLKHTIFLKFAQQMAESLMIVVCVGWIVPPITIKLFPNATSFVSFMFMYGCYHYIRKFGTIFLGSFRKGIKFAAMCFLVRLYFQFMDLIMIEPLYISIKKTLLYALTFYFLHSFLALYDEKKGKLRFAPIIFVGALLTNTNFLNFIINFLKSFRN